MPSATSRSNVPLRVIVLVGLPGCGKSTYAEKLGVAALSSDHLRWLLMDDPTNQEIHRRVFGLLRLLLRIRLELKRPVTIVDATNLTRKERRAYIKMGEFYGARVEAIFFDTPLSVCQERNARRARVVPPEALAGLALKLQPPSLDEGFASIEVVSQESA